MNPKMERLWATKTSDDEWWSSFVTSPLAVLANYVVVDVAWLTPNIVTVASFLAAIVAAGLIVIGGATSFLLAALLIHVSHIFDCMDGQMARYRGTTSAAGSFYDRATDQIQVILWFGAAAYADYEQSSSVVPVFLSLIGIGFYSLRGYVKYVAIHAEMLRDSDYLDRIAASAVPSGAEEVQRPRLDLQAGLRWFVREQRKILRFDEGVFVFMLAAALLLDQLTPMLWVFATSQLCYGLFRTWQQGRNIELNAGFPVEK
ncbi:MAG: phosphatidylglycerophosphate synthase [Paracrocinitomix sp.]|jgi:phosphatidylglycerophosphate synthase